MTAFFAVFFGFFQSYTSQSLVFSFSGNSISSEALWYSGKNPASGYKKKSFTGAFMIQSISSISWDVFNPKKPNNFQSYLEYPEFIYISDTPIQNFLKAQYRKAQSDLKNVKRGEFGKYPEFNARFEGYSNSRYKSLIYFLSYHIDGGFPYQRMHMFLINSSGAYVSPYDLVSIPSQVDFTQVVRPYLQKQSLHLFPGDEFIDGINHYISHPIFAFDGDDIILFFEAGTIAQREDGNISVRIAYEHMKPFISQDPKRVGLLKEIQFWKNQNIASQSRLSKDWKKYVALTFDDGPNNTSTLKLLRILEKKWVKATFFVLGKNANQYPQVLKKIHDAWHEIESHTWDHPSLTKLSKDGIKAQIESTDRVIERVIWKKSRFVRPPYGAFNSKVQDVIGKPLLMWSVDPKDWKYRNIQHNISSTMKQVKNGSIILYHDIHDVSVRTIPRLIDELRLRGYEFLTVEQLFMRYQSKIPEGSLACYSGDVCKR